MPRTLYPSCSYRAMCKAIKIMVVCALAAVLSCRYRGEVGQRAEAASPEVKACAECHVQTYAEWRAGPHSKAFTNERFQALSDGARAPGCAACHAPETIVAAQHAVPLRAGRATGVDCFSCHVFEGAYRGPFKPKHAPHPVATNTKLYRSSEFCGTCHRGTFEEWSAAPALAKARHCQQCHLAKVTRTTELNTLFSRSGRIYQTRSHNADLRSIERFPDGFRLAILRGDEATSPPRITVRVENRLPHSFPTGDYGYREGVMEVAFVRADGAKIAAKNEKTFFKQLKTALPSFAEKEFHFTFPADAPTTPSAVAITIYRVSWQGEKKIVVAEERIPFSEVKRTSDVAGARK
jgi:hypothetical protein